MPLPVILLPFYEKQMRNLTNVDARKRKILPQEGIAEVGLLYVGTSFLMAVTEEDIDLLANALTTFKAHEIDINQRFPLTGMTPLIQLIQERNKLIAQDKQNSTNETQNQKEIRSQKIKKLESLILAFLDREELDVDAVEKFFEHTALNYACQHNENSDIVKKLLVKGAKVNGLDEDRNSPLLSAVCFNAEEIVQLLLASEQCNPRQALGTVSPLNVACKNGNYQIVQLLLARGAIPTYSRDFLGNSGSTLFDAIFSKHLPLIEHILTISPKNNAWATHIFGLSLQYVRNNGDHEITALLERYKNDFVDFNENEIKKAQYNPRWEEMVQIGNADLSDQRKIQDARNLLANALAGCYQDPKKLDNVINYLKNTFESFEVKPLPAGMAYLYFDYVAMIKQDIIISLKEHYAHEALWRVPTLGMLAQLRAGLDNLIANSHYDVNIEKIIILARLPAICRDNKIITLVLEQIFVKILQLCEQVESTDLKLETVIELIRIRYSLTLFSPQPKELKILHANLRQHIEYVFDATNEYHLDYLYIYMLSAIYLMQNAPEELTLPYLEKMQHHAAKGAFGSNKTFNAAKSRFNKMLNDHSARIKKAISAAAEKQTTTSKAEKLGKNKAISYTPMYNIKKEIDPKADTLTRSNSSSPTTTESSDDDNFASSSSSSSVTTSSTSRISTPEPAQPGHHVDKSYTRARAAALQAMQKDNFWIKIQEARDSKRKKAQEVDEATVRELYKDYLPQDCKIKPLFYSNVPDGTYWAAFALTSLSSDLLAQFEEEFENKNIISKGGNGSGFTYDPEFGFRLKLSGAQWGDNRAGCIEYYYGEPKKPMPILLLFNRSSNHLKQGEELARVQFDINACGRRTQRCRS